MKMLQWSPILCTMHDKARQKYWLLSDNIYIAKVGKPSTEPWWLNWRVNHMWLYISGICINANIDLRKVYKSCVFICVHMCRRCVHHSSIYEHVCIFQGTYDYVWCQGWLQMDRGILEVKVWYWELQVRVALDYAPWTGKSLRWTRNP